MKWAISVNHIGLRRRAKRFPSQTGARNLRSPRRIYLKTNIVCPIRETEDERPPFSHLTCGHCDRLISVTAMGGAFRAR